MSEMRMIGKIVGLFCLVAMFAASMVAAGTASAAPHWLVCLASHTGTTTTKWETHQCEKAASGGSWEWSEAGTEYAVVTHETLKLEAPDPLGGTVTQICAGTGKGFIGPGNKDRTTEITIENCTASEKCEEVVKKAEPIDLPWKSEMLETEGKMHDTVRSGGSGEPGWRVACKVSGLSVENECKSEKGLVVLEGEDTAGAETPLLVLASFIEPNKPKANCTSTGTESGDVLGSVATSLENKWGLRLGNRLPKFLAATNREGMPLLKKKETALFRILNVSGLNGVKLKEVKETPLPVGAWKIRGAAQEAKKKECEEKAYIVAEECFYEIEYVKEEKGTDTLTVVDEANVASSATVTGE